MGSGFRSEGEQCRSNRDELLAMNCGRGQELEDLAIAEGNCDLVRPTRLQAIRWDRSARDSLVPAEPEDSCLLDARVSETEGPTNTEIAHAFVTAVVAANH